MASEMWRVAADAFIAGRDSKGKYRKKAFGMYHIEELRNGDGTPNGTERLVYITSDKKYDVVAYRGDNGMFCNSSILPMVGRTFAWGTEMENRKETPVQQYFRAKGARMVPIYQLKDNGFDITKITVAEAGKEETVVVKGEEYYDYTTRTTQRKPDENRHFTGAMLLNCVNGNGDSFQFLFDIDRIEVKHKRFNPFFVQLVKPVKTIAEAYQSLKPKQVIKAERMGLDVKRQGEWFFIPTKFNPEKGNKDPKNLPLEEKLIACMGTWRNNDYFSEEEHGALLKRREAILGRRIGESTLRAGQNRPNSVQFGTTIKEVTYVKGKVTHTGREHEDLVLEGWHIAIPNTSVKSWQLDGNID